MYETITNYLSQWKATKDNRRQLQDVYLVLGSTTVILAGLVTFLNANLGYTMVTVGLVLLGVYLFNAVAWHLVSSAFLSVIKKPTRKK